MSSSSFQIPTLPVYDTGSVTTGGAPIPSLMQSHPLLIHSLLTHAASYHPNREIISALPELPPTSACHRYTNRDMNLRVHRLANVLIQELNVKMGDFVATLAHNTHRHVECYYAISGIGAVLHTLNPRLYIQQLEYIINHAQDSIIFVDAACIHLIENLMKRANIATTIKIVLMVDEIYMPKSLPFSALCYETLLSQSSTHFKWPNFPETAASSCCYTSGTTGAPKGVLFSHRSTVLHAFSLALRDTFGLCSADTLLAVVPLYHVNGWAVHYTAAMVGTKMVLPGIRMDGESLCHLLQSEEVTTSNGVPSVWLSVLQYLDSHPNTKLSHLQRIIVGGSAAPRMMIERFAAMNIQILHAWGMTELSPIGTIGALLPKHSHLSADEQMKVRLKQGRGVYGVEMRLVDPETRQKIPHDGNAVGELTCRGPWTTCGYYKLDSFGSAASSWEEQKNTDTEGFFATNDIGNIDTDGYLQLVDRSKDVIKSGGEWISSIDLENAALHDTRIAEAAVIGIAHSKWQERPLLIAVKKKGCEVNAEGLLNVMKKRVAGWQLPDAVIFVEELPHTATGKLLKTALRKQFKDYRFPSDTSASVTDSASKQEGGVKENQTSTLSSKL